MQKKVILGVFVALFGAVTFAGVLRLSAQRELAPSPARAGHAWQLVEQLAAADTAHIKARLTVHRNDLDEPNGGPGRFEYWASGSRYRVSCETHSALQMMDDVDLAFNGELFQFFLHEIATLALEDQEPTHLDTAVPNPLYLPLSFLVDDISTLRLADIAEGRFSREWLDRSATYEIEGETRGEKKRFVVHVEDTGDVSLIETFRAEGPLEWTLHLSGYPPKDSTVFRFPRQLQMHGYGADDPLSPRQMLRFDVEEVELDAPISESVFEIDRSIAEHVWDGRRRVFVKGPE